MNPSKAIAMLEMIPLYLLSVVTLFNYRRELDLKTAVQTVAYTSGGVDYTREYFTSYPAKVLAVRLTADQLSAGMVSPPHPAQASFELLSAVSWPGPCTPRPDREETALFRNPYPSFVNSVYHITI